MNILDRFSKSYLSVGIFTRRAYAAYWDFDDDEIRLRRGDGCKKLLEEILPIAAFLKHIEVPGRYVKCRWFPGNQNYDARLKISGIEVQKGMLKESYFIEVTSAVSKNDYLKREALSRYGCVFGGDDIHRVGSRRKGEIISRAVAENREAAIIKSSNWVIVQLRAKARKQYPIPCILLVQVKPERRLSISEWSMIADRVQGEVDRSAFEHTFLVNAWDNIVIRI
jgi:hypothetical protein